MNNETIDRKLIASEFIRLYKESRVRSRQPRGNGHRINQVTMIHYVKDCGKYAEDALPILKKDKNSQITSVRDAATFAVEQIEEAISESKKQD